jgi:hypothetical protein
VSMHVHFLQAVSTAAPTIAMMHLVNPEAL